MTETVQAICRGKGLAVIIPCHNEAVTIGKVERRQGKGNVVRQMMRDIDAEAYLMVDGDDTYLDWFSRS